MKIQFLIITTFLLLCFACGEIEQPQYDNSVVKKAPAEGCSRTLTEDEFEEFITIIAEEHMPAEKVREAKIQCKYVCMTSNQVRDIVDLISFPNEQLQFAKFAYRRVIDKENFRRVESSISFPTDKKALKNYVRTWDKEHRVES